MLFRSCGDEPGFEVWFGGSLPPPGELSVKSRRVSRRVDEG